MLSNNNDILDVHLKAVTELLHSDLDKSLVGSLSDYQLRIEKAKVDFADAPEYLERTVKRINLSFMADLERNQFLKARFGAKVKELIQKSTIT